MDRVFCWPLLVAFLWLTGAPSPALAQPPILTVISTGSVPGFASAEVPSYLSVHMSDIPLADWQFEPVSADFVPPVDRVEWSFRLAPEVSGEASSPSLNKRRFVARQLVLVEVRLFLDNEFQTVTFAQTEIYGGPQDEELATFVRRLSQRLLGAEGAYRAIQRRPAAGERG